jgi:hypothetical protein
LQPQITFPLKLCWHEYRVPGGQAAHASAMNAIVTANVSVAPTAIINLFRMNPPVGRRNRGPRKSSRQNSHIDNRRDVSEFRLTV